MNMKKKEALNPISFRQPNGKRLLAGHVHSFHIIPINANGAKAFDGQSLLLCFLVAVRAINLLLVLLEQALAVELLRGGDEAL